MSGFLQQLAQLIAHPASNLAAAAIGLSIVVLFVMILLVIAVAWVLAGSTDEEDDDEGDEDYEDGPPAPARIEHRAPAEPGRVREALASPLAQRVRVWAVVVLLLAGAVGGYVRTSSNEYCGSSCHAMLSSRDSWTQGPHESIACVRCHEGAPRVPVVSSSLSRVRCLVAAAFGRSARGGSVPPDRCLACHRSIGTGTLTTDRGIRVRHSDILAAGGTCTTCHGSVGHARQETASSVAVMPECLRCHDGKKAPAKCEECHRGDVGRVPVVKRYLVPVELPKPTCGGCHSEAKCDACHGLRMPHPEGFGDPAKHAYQGAFEKRTLCYRCHVFADCSRCHRQPFEGAHGPGWKARHQGLPVSAGVGCLQSCHQNSRGGNMCIDCHPKMARSKVSTP